MESDASDNSRDKKKLESPVLARRLLRRILTARQREFALGDLEEEFAAIARGPRGARGGRIWYWRQTVAFLLGKRATRATDRRWNWRGIVGGFWRDARFGFRLLRRKPGFAAAAILIVGLGIGSNTAIFSVVEGVLLRGLPILDADRVVTLWETNQRDGIDRDDVSPANFLDWQERQDVFEAMATSNPWSLDYTGGDEPETFQAALVSQGFFRLLGCQAWLGRTFLDLEHQPGRDDVVVITYGLWKTRFGSDPAAVGRVVSLDGTPTRIIGVLPADFEIRLHNPPRQAFKPQIVDETWREQRRATYLKVVAKLKPGVSIEQARSSMGAIASQISEALPMTNAAVGVAVVPIWDHLVGDVRPAILLLSAAVSLVLLIVCANCATLMLARGSQRVKEIAVRQALGAGGTRILRQLLTESLTLSLLGSAFGVALAYLGVSLLKNVAPGGIPRLQEVGVGLPALAFSMLLAMGTALLFGAAPALEARRVRFLTLRESAGEGRSRSRFRSALIVAEVALSLILLTGAGLLGRSFVNLLNSDTGFRRDRVIALQTFLWDRYTQPAQRLQFTSEVMRRMEAVPGVVSASVTTALPFVSSSRSSSVPVTVRGEAPPPPGQEPTVFYTLCSPDYFSALGVNWIAGRQFDSRDERGDAPLVAIVNASAAKKIGLAAGAVGREIELHLREPATTARVVGVVGDLRHERLNSEPRAELFLPYGRSGNGSVIFVVRTAGDPSPLVPALKQVIWQLDPSQALYLSATVEELVDETLAARRFTLWMLGLFAALALVLAAVGIYGVMAAVTATRRHEIGVRIALGAAAADILRIVVGPGLRLAGIGLAVGWLCGLALARLLGSLLVGVPTWDPATYAGAASVLLFVALAACYLPARRASRTDPRTVLRSD